MEKVGVFCEIGNEILPAFKNLNFKILDFLVINIQIWHLIRNKGKERGTGRACSTYVRGGI